MKTIVLTVASLYGILSVVFGAFGAHALKKILDSDKLMSFEVGVRYQMYHALLLLILGFVFDFSTKLETWSCMLIIIGTFMFSFSIYGLSLSNVYTLPTKILGPITPLGGLLMICGWFLLILIVLKRF